MSTMNKEDLQYIVERLESTVSRKMETTVNGKIDKLHKKFDEKFKEHEEKMLPIYEAYKAANTVGKITSWVAKFILSVGVITTGIVTAIKFLGDK